MARHPRLRIGLASAIAVLCPALPGIARAGAVQGSPGLQDGWAVGDQGQTTGGQLLSDELGYMQQAGAGRVRVNLRLGQCFTNWTSTGCNGLTRCDPIRAIAT